MEENKDSLLSLFSVSQEGVNIKKIDKSDLKLTEDSKNNLLLVNTIQDKDLIEDICKIYGVKDILENTPTKNYSSKLRYYEKYLYLSMKISSYEGEILQHENYVIILGENFSLCFFESTEFLDNFSKKNSFTSLLGGQSINPIFLCFSVFSLLVMRQIKTVHHLADKITALDKDVTEDPNQNQIDTLNTLNQQVSQITRHSRPVTEIINALEKGDIDYKNSVAKSFANNLNNELKYFINLLTYKKQYLLNLKDYILSSINNRMTIAAQNLSVIATVFMPLTFIAGVYGMNFVHMPELPGEYSYYYCLGFMLFLVCLQVFYFKKKNFF